MRVAIIGGTGFVGSYLIDALTAAGHEISALVREGSEDKLPRSDLWRTVSGDVSSREAIDATVKDCDAAIYCVGILREKPSQGITFEALQYEGAAQMIDSSVQQGVQRFLLMSANGVKDPGTPYQATKKRAEDALLASSLDGTVFRPSVIFGDPRGRMEFGTQLYQQMVKPPIPAVGFFSGLSPTKGAVLMSPVHVKDVADAFVAALDNDSTIGQTYELGGPEVLTWPEMIRRIGRSVGKNKWVIPFPIELMKVAAFFLDWLPFFPATRDQLTMLEDGNRADPAIIESLIGRTPKAFNTENLDYLDR